MARDTVEVPEEVLADLLDATDLFMDRHESEAYLYEDSFHTAYSIFDNK